MNDLILHLYVTLVNNKVLKESYEKFNQWNYAQTKGWIYVYGVVALLLIVLSILSFLGIFEKMDIPDISARGAYNRARHY